MADKSWMLNPKAIRHANECIHLIKECEGVRLKLSQPNFMQELHAYVEKIRSTKLGEHYSNLLAMAGVGNVMRNLEQMPAKAVSALPITSDSAAAPKKHRVRRATNDEWVEYHGQNYERYRGDLEFKGLYRGSPRYA